MDTISLYRKSCVFLLVILMLTGFMRLPVYAAPSWPSNWIQVNSDKNEDGSGDDWRDVEFAYYQFDSSYLYLKLKCYALPGSQWTAHSDGRYKWFIDLDANMRWSGGNVLEAEYLLFVEDEDHNGVGEVYLIYDSNNDGNFNEYEPWPPANYANYRITDLNVAGYRIVAVNQIEMYVSWARIGNPTSYRLTWATDTQDPNLDATSTTDHYDLEQPIIVHDVAATSQTPSPTTVTPGEHVTISVVVQNQGTVTESFNVTCYAGSYPIGTLRVTNLAAGASYTLSFDWDTTGVLPGTYAITAWADSDAEITEIDDTDNICTAPASVVVATPKLHDVAAVSQVPSSAVVNQGDVISIEVVVNNLGDFYETFNVTCYRDSTQIGRQRVYSLAPGAGETLIFSWNTAGVFPGTYNIKALADSGYEITESNEINNWCTAQASVQIVIHDVAAISQTPSPTTVTEGSHVIVGVVVRNLGSVTESFDVTCYAGSHPIGTLRVTNLAAGASYTLSFDWDTTGMLPGVYAITAWADSGAEIDEVDGTNNFCTAPATVTVQERFHDVAATSQDPDKTSVQQGGIVSIDVTVENLGNYYTETFQVTCYYDSTPVASPQTVTNLALGATTHVFFAWNTAAVPSGTYMISAMADSAHAITEVDEDNNLCTSIAAVTVYVVTEPGRLSVDKALNAVVSGPDPPEVGSTTVYELIILVSNPGGSSVTGVSVEDIISSDVTYISVGVPSQGSVSYVSPKIIWSVGTLGAGATATLAFRVSLTPSTTGVKHLNQKEDLSASGLTNGTPLSDEGDTDVTVIALERDVAAISQTPSATVVDQGLVIAVDVVVSNFGDLYETFDVTCYGGAIEIGTERVYGLAPGTSETLIFSWNTAGVPPGIYSIRAVADSSLEIVESNEGNNECTASAYVQIVIHDVAAIGQTPLPGTVTVGDHVTVDVTVQNLGSVTESFDVTCYAGSEPIGTLRVTNLAAGASYTLSFDWDTTGMPPGTYAITAWADSGAEIDEVDGTNNFCTAPATVTLQAPKYHDVAATGQVPSTTVVGQGDVISIDVTVSNLGDFSETFNVTCYAGSIQVGRERVYDLAPSTSETLPFRWNTAGVPPGIHIIRAVADSASEILESNEANNECTAPASVEIVIHDVAAVSQTPSPTTVTEGDTVTIQVVVENQGTEPESFTVKCQCYNLDFTFDAGSPQTVSLAPGATTTLTFFWSTVGVLPGTYYITAVAFPVSGERDLDDNVCTSTTIVTISPLPTAGALSVDKAKTAVISGFDPPMQGRPTVYEITITVQNVGGSSLTSVKVGDKISPDVSFTSLGTPSQGSATYVSPKIVWNVGTLAAGATATLAFRVSLTPSTAGVEYLNAKEDLSASGLTIFSTLVLDQGNTDLTVTATSPPVGGEWVPIGRFQLLAPWMILALVIALSVSLVGFRRLKKRRD